jgi:hypothetical protein
LNLDLTLAISAPAVSRIFFLGPRPATSRCRKCCVDAPADWHVRGFALPAASVAGR